MLDELDESLENVGDRHMDKSVSEDRPMEMPLDTPVEPKQPKQYLLMLDEMGIAFMSKLMPSMKYILVEGMVVEGNKNHQFLVNPNKPSDDNSGQCSDANTNDDNTQNKE